jgi:hypothetical protein
MLRAIREQERGARTAPSATAPAAHSAVPSVYAGHVPSSTGGLVASAPAPGGLVASAPAPSSTGGLVAIAPAPSGGVSLRALREEQRSAAAAPPNRHEQVGTPRQPASSMRLVPLKVEDAASSRPSPAISAGAAPAASSRSVSFASPIVLPQSGGGLAAPAAPISSREDENAAKRSTAAKKLIDSLPPGSIPTSGSGASRIPAHVAGDPAAIAAHRLTENGGVTGAANDTLRLFLRDWSRFRAVAEISGGMFPIPSVDVEQLRLWLLGKHAVLGIEKEEPYGASRVVDALKYALTLGLPVEVDEAMLASRNTRAAVHSVNAPRAAAPPFCYIGVFGTAAQRPGYPQLSEVPLRGAAIMHVYRRRFDSSRSASRLPSVEADPSEKT